LFDTRVVTTSEDITDNDCRILTRYTRRGRQAPGPGVAAAVAGSTKRFPQFPPPGATAAAAKAARAGDVSDHQRSVSLPVLSSKACTTSSVNNMAMTPSFELSLQHQQQQSSPGDRGEPLQV